MKALLAALALWLLAGAASAQFNNPSLSTPTTGTGSYVLSTSPTLVSPALGTIASGVATNLTGTAASLTVGTANTVVYTGSAPSVSAGGGCGGSPSIDANSTNYSGKVTVGTSTTTCVITFNAGGFASYNHCTVSSGTGTLAAFAYVYTKAAITVSATVLGGDLLDYRCDGA